MEPRKYIVTGASKTDACMFCGKKDSDLTLRIRFKDTGEEAILCLNCCQKAGVLDNVPTKAS